MRRSLAVLCAGCLVAGFGTGCHTIPALPPADLASADWKTLQGQAVWKPGPDKPELAGELLMATQPSGNVFVQFAKPPFTLATARLEGTVWQIDLGSGRYTRSGKVPAPSRFVWFELPRVMGAGAPDRDWQFDRLPDHSWKLENRRTGEWLAGQFLP